MKLLAAILLGIGLSACETSSQNSDAMMGNAPIILEDMGSFSAGGTLLGDANSESLSCNHGHVEFAIPQNPRPTSLMMWHSSSTAVWQNRWDGGEGYQSIFLRRGYPVYLWDGPGVGRADWACEPQSYVPTLRDQANFIAWRFGTSFKQWHEGIQFPVENAEAWNQAMRARYNEFDTLDNALLQADAAAEAVDRIGPVVALTNSAGGWRALLTRLKSDNIVGIVAYETPGFVFPIEEGYTTDTEAPYGPVAVPMSEFMRLTQIPIQLVFGDYVEGTQWEARLANARIFAGLINANGGDAEVLVLPEAGLTGNTHIAMADMNNQEVADLLADWLERKGF